MKLTFKVQKKAEYIFEYLSDMQKFVSVHPVISKAEKTGINSYLIHETLKFAFIPFSFTYPVKIQSDPETQTAIYKGVVFKLIQFELNFILKGDKDFTTVQENITFKSLLPIKSLLKKVFKKQHILLFKNIEST